MGQYLSLLTKVKDLIYKGQIVEATSQLKYLLNLLNGDYINAKTKNEKDRTRQVIVTFLPALNDLKKGIVSDVVIQSLKLDSSRLRKEEPADDFSDFFKEEAKPVTQSKQRDIPKEEEIEYAPKEEIEEQREKPSKTNLLGKAMRPMHLKDYYGQPHAVAMLNDPIKKAILTGSTLPHILICGSYGQGKTTLARIIANEMEGKFVEVTASIKPKDLLRTLKDMGPDTIIFIDEVHKLSTDIIETLLYPAMEDYQINYVEQKGNSIKNVTTKICPFTLIGATTESGKLLKPFYSKFPIKITLEEYTEEVMLSIIKNSFANLGMHIDDSLALNIAKRSRLLPRLANAFVEGIASSAIVKYAETNNIVKKGAFQEKEDIEKLNISIEEDIITKYFDNLAIDENGLNQEDIKLLKTLVENYQGGPVGLETLAKALNMASNRIDQEYEPYLIKLGMIGINPQGRYATDKAYQYLGISKYKPKNEQEVQKEQEEDDPSELKIIEDQENIESLDEIEDLKDQESIENSNDDDLDK